mmetsp:Transcript_917/g.1268  ORF Transcript_917/g.1268 Transcript_917/m.1268 type:complete len:583 (-) Transcript_917:136-1884(-)
MTSSNGEVKKRNAASHTPLLRKTSAGEAPFRQVSEVVQEANFFAWVEKLRDAYGSSILMTIVLVSHLCVRFIPVSVSIGYYLREFGGVKAPEVQAYKAVARTPYAMSPLFGFISDAFHFRGYHKAPYIAVSSVFAMAAYAIVGFTPVGGLSLAMVLVGFVTMNMQMEYCGLLVRAKYAEKLKTVPKYSTDLISFVQGGGTIATLLSQVIAAYIIQNHGTRYVFAMCVFPAALPLYPVAVNLLQEKPLPNSSCCGLAKKTLKHGKQYLYLCLFMGALAVLLMCLGLFPNSELRCILGLAASVSLAIGFYMLTPNMIAKVAIFFLSVCICSLSNSGAEYYFYTDTPEQYPEGPHFSAWFYLMVRSFVRSTCLFIGMWAFNKYLRNCKYKVAYLIGIGTTMCVRFARLLIFSRLNLELGLPDTTFCLILDALGAMFGELIMLPNQILMSHLCPKGLESTMFACMAGAFTMGGQVGTFLGAYLLKKLGVEPQGANGESSQFDNLWIAEMVSAIACVPPLFMMLMILPDKTPSERIILEDDTTQNGDDDEDEDEVAEDTEAPDTEARDEEGSGVRRRTRPVRHARRK